MPTLKHTLLPTLALLATAAFSRADSTVSPNGKEDGADFATIQSAIDAAPQLTAHDQPWTIHVKPGTYHEILYVQREKRFIKLQGEDPEKTTITYALYANVKGPDDKPIGTFRTPTAYVDADDFACENLTFENAAGRKGQALALRLDGDRITLTHCRLLGYQDTLLANRGRHYFKDCYIAGATDFIFGAATAYFDHCQIHAVASGYLTAASTPEEQPQGFVFNHCTVTAANDDTKFFLGRPWRAYAATAFLNTDLPAQTRPEAWNNWGRPQREKTARYAEYKSTGPGANPDQRAPWSHQLTDQQAAQFTKQKVLAGPDDWDGSFPFHPAPKQEKK